MYVWKTNYIGTIELNMEIMIDLSYTENLLALYAFFCQLYDDESVDHSWYYLGGNY